MKLIRATLLVASLMVGLASNSDAQISFSGGSFSGGGLGFSNYGSASGFSSYSGFGPGLGYTNNYQSFSNTGYLAGPGVIGGTFGPYTGYSSGYSGLGGVNRLGYQNRPYYGAYGYGNYGYGSRDGFAPFRPFNRFRR